MNPPPLRAVLFDLDGTLIGSIEHIISCWQHTVRQCLGREIAREDVVTTLGRALLECFEEIAPGQGESMREVYRAYQRETHDHMVTPIPGTCETLVKLSDSGLTLGVVTSKGLPVTLEGLDLFGLRPYFSTIVTYEDTTRHKPHPDPLLVAAERLAIPPAETIYVGDALFDIQAAQAAGSRSVGVTWGAGTREELTQAGAELVINNMQELLTILQPQPSLNSA